MRGELQREGEMSKPVANTALRCGKCPMREQEWRGDDFRCHLFAGWLTDNSLCVDRAYVRRTAQLMMRLLEEESDNAPS